MKTNLLMMLALMLWPFCPIDATPIVPAPCEDFENGTFGGWDTIASELSLVVNNGGHALRIKDEGGASWAYNPNYNHQNMSCGSFTYQYELVEDGWPGAYEVFNQLQLITDLDNPSNLLTATFVLNEPFTENTGVMDITIPIHPIASGDPLPSNELGSWQMLYPSLWNYLIDSYVAVGFFVDVLESQFTDEVIVLDNFCANPVPNFDANLNFDIRCIDGVLNLNVTNNNQFGYTYSWELYQTDQPGQASGGTLIDSGQTGSSATFAGLDPEGYYYVSLAADNICMESFVSTQILPDHQIEPIFHFEDAMGNEKTTFCYGEDVYLDGSDSYGENNYWIGISRRPIPNNGQGYQDYEFLGWSNGEVGVVNLSEAYADLDYIFEPGWEYRVKLAVQNVGRCVNWVELEQTFEVECCDDFFNAAFELERRVVPGSDLYALVAANYLVYENVDVQHTWTIYSSPNLDGGPYTLVDEVMGDELYYEVEEGLCYFVIHSVETPCGEDCYGQSDCINAGENAGRDLCELCGPIDCSILDEPCMAPSGLQFDCQGTRPIIVTLSWSAIPNVPGYVVEITWNDDACCVTPEPEVTIPYYTSNNQLTINELIQPDWDCFRWRVGTVCENGAEVWSDYQCFNGCFFGSIPTVETALPSKTNIYPNPTNDLVQLSFEEAFTGEVQLTDKLGRVIQTQSLSEAFRTELDLTSLPTGLYWVVTVNEAGTTSYKLIKQ